VVAARHESKGAAISQGPVIDRIHPTKMLPHGTGAVPACVIPVVVVARLNRRRSAQDQGSRESQLCLGEHRDFSIVVLMPMIGNKLRTRSFQTLQICKVIGAALFDHLIGAEL
jgi:hypothetical protein